MEASGSTADSKAPVPLSVVEDHDEALVVIYRAIGSKKLPLSGICLVHFDAHPDLLSPNLPVDEFCDKEKLFAYTSIAEWILPAVYAGHLGCVVWIKPPWCSQMNDGEYALVVGRDSDTGHIRVATSLAYFISDQLYAPAERLSQTRTIPLHVVTLPVLELASHAGRPSLTGEPENGEPENVEPESGEPENVEPESGKKGSLQGREVRSCGMEEISCSVSLEDFKDEEDRRDENSSSLVPCQLEHPRTASTPASLEGVELCPPLSKKSRTQQHSLTPSPTHTPIPPPTHDHSSLMSRAVSVVCDAVEKSSAWILDIDLDFFSTANPFQEDFSHEEYSFLERLYRFKEPLNESQESVDECVRGREEQLESLMELWGQEEECSPLHSDTALISALKTKIGVRTGRDGNPLEAQDVHLAGMMTDLPHHPASGPEVEGLMEATSLLLKAAAVSRMGLARLPSLVTMARSTEDGYTPPDQVEELQAAVVGVVTRLCGGSRRVQLHSCYLDPAHP